MADGTMSMMKLFDVPYDHGPATLAYITSQMEPMGAPAVLKTLRLYFDRGDVTCTKVGVGVLWSLGDTMRKTIAAKRGDQLEPTGAERDAPAPEKKGAPDPSPAPSPKPKGVPRKPRSLVVRRFIPARPELTVTESAGLIFINERMPEDESANVQIIVEPDELDALIEALQQLQRHAA